MTRLKEGQWEEEQAARIKRALGMRRKLTEVSKGTEPAQDNLSQDTGRKFASPKEERELRMELLQLRGEIAEELKKSSALAPKVDLRFI